MSKKSTIIEIIPPDRLKKEVLVVSPQTCGYCHGNGWHWGPQLKKVKCPDCGGTGEVKAIVTIDWQANKK